MAVLAFLSNKGGSGKTTIAVHTAVAAQAAGVPVMLLDTDPQQNAMQWSHLRKAPRPVVRSIPPARLAGVIAGATADGYLVLVDTPGLTDPVIARVVTLADLILIPCQPSFFDLLGILSTVDLVQASQRPAAFLLNMCRPQVREVAESRGVLATYPLPLAPVTVGHRIVFARAVAAGQGVTEYAPRGEAAREILALWTWIATQIGVSHGEASGTHQSHL